MNKDNNSKTVVVGMSGGVDSSVAAYLLKNQGYNVIGVTMQIWQDEENTEVENNGGCCGLTAVDDARRVCNKIGIPHYVMNFKEQFKCNVIDNFVEEYFAGRTPNPCIRCNRYVKWEALLDRSLEIGAEYIATGHYARLEKTPEGRFAIKKSVTDAKDQTYALYNLTQEQLEHTLFPIGDYEKSAVRDIAYNIGLNVAHKKDSQEICFIPDNNYGKFLEDIGAKVPPQGEFTDKAGNVLGTHKGVHHYTMGQRRGLGIAFSERLFVCDINAESNKVVLGLNQDVFDSTVYFSEINHMGLERFPENREVSAKIRYNAKDQACKITYLSDTLARCDFVNPVRAITPGQSIVVYDGDIVLGGGLIVKTPIEEERI